MLPPLSFHWRCNSKYRFSFSDSLKPSHFGKYILDAFLLLRVLGKHLDGTLYVWICWMFFSILGFFKTYYTTERVIHTVSIIFSFNSYLDLLVAGDTVNPKKVNCLPKQLTVARCRRAVLCYNLLFWSESVTPIFGTHCFLDADSTFYPHSLPPFPTISNLPFVLAVVDQDGYVKSQIVIGTAGTVSLWMRGTGPYRLDPYALQMFVLDEADIMMEESGFLHTSRRIVQ